MSDEAILEALRRLRLFNEKADRLERRSICRRIMKNDFSVAVFVDEEGHLRELVTEDLDEEALDAFALTYRFFVQPRDKISLDQIAELYRSLHQVDPAIVARVDVRARAVATTRDSFAGFAYSDIDRLTKGDVVDHFLYGDLAHSKPEHVERYQRHMTTWSGIRTYAIYAFVTLVGETTNAFMEIRDINSEVIETLSVLVEPTQI